MIKRIISFFKPMKPINISREMVEDSLYKKYGWYYNVTERCPICNKLYYMGVLPAGAEPCCEGHPKDIIYRKIYNNDFAFLILRSEGHTCPNVWFVDENGNLQQASVDFFCKIDSPWERDTNTKDENGETIYDII